MKKQERRGGTSENLIFSFGIKKEKLAELCDTKPSVKVKQRWEKRDKIYSENRLLINSNF